MATETVNEALHPDREERTATALEAAWEMESLAEALVERSQDLAASDLVIRSLSLRAKELACIVMSALDDQVDPLADIRERLTGVRR